MGRLLFLHGKKERKKVPVNSMETLQNKHSMIGLMEALEYMICSDKDY